MSSHDPFIVGRKVTTKTAPTKKHYRWYVTDAVLRWAVMIHLLWDEKSRRRFLQNTLLLLRHWCCIKVSSNVNHCHDPFIVGRKVAKVTKTVPTKYTLSWKRKETQWNRTEACLLFISLAYYRWCKPAHAYPPTNCSPQYTGQTTVNRSEVSL